MLKLKTGAWVLVADSEKALVLENAGDTRDYVLKVRRKTAQDNPPTREQAANRPGRQADVAAGHRSAFEDTDWHELEKARFAEDLAERLYAWAHAGQFDEIVLVAAPDTLGALRPALHPEVRERIVAEIPKTLTNTPIDRIERHVKEELESA